MHARTGNGESVCVCIYTLTTIGFSRYLIKATAFLFILFVISGRQKPQQTLPVDICTFPHQAEGFALLPTQPRESST